ncbi:MAG: hypothetical protein OYI31_06290 [Chloroflexota bacterium]|nr:hypothetical protein [Chloroflexota bacterium]MDE2942127.1 hypothetical protein [Chloroflexota bacterium]MDE3268041.1 hypothetical protein [Chloroflexota bacterium]
MASPALVLSEGKVKRYTDSRHANWLDQRHRVHERLHFPLETRGMRTPFRNRVLDFIYRTALDLSGGLLEFAAVSVSSQPGEEDSLTLDLTMTVNAEWELIRELRHGILVKVGEWSQEWSEYEQEDYGRRIYFSLIPSSL